MYLNFWPRVKVRQPTELKGQIYIPSVNNILWFGCILMILYFRSSTHMEAAYGFSITIAMMMTTILLSYFMIYRLKWNKYLVIGIRCFLQVWSFRSSLPTLQK
jgi:KUP system potassium uptake protein